MRHCDADGGFHAVPRGAEHGRTMFHGRNEDSLSHFCERYSYVQLLLGY